jgi:hypothetical protein
LVDVLAIRYHVILDVELLVADIIKLLHNCFVLHIRNQVYPLFVRKIGVIPQRSLWSIFIHFISHYALHEVNQATLNNPILSEVLRTCRHVLLLTDFTVTLLAKQLQAELQAHQALTLFN